MRAIAHILAALLAAAVLSSCTVIKVQALSPGKTYAVVSTAVSKQLQESSVKLRGRKVMTFNTIDKEANGIAFRYLTGLRRVVPFRVIHGKQVVSNRNYRRWKVQDKSHGLERQFQTAKGYHLIAGKDLERMGELARALKVDGVLVLRHQLTVMEPENQLRVGARLTPAVITTISAWDNQGNKVLEDVASYSNMPGVDFKQQSEKAALKQVLEVIADHMEAAGEDYGQGLKKKIGWHGGGGGNDRPL